MNRNLPVPAAPAEEPRRERARPRTGATGRAGAYDAQMLGQDGAKRGLKGGEPVLKAARSAYLSAEYSGEADRRPVPGLLTRSRI